MFSIFGRGFLFYIFQTLLFQKLQLRFNNHGVVQKHEKSPTGELWQTSRLSVCHLFIIALILKSEALLYYIYLISQIFTFKHNIKIYQIVSMPKRLKNTHICFIYHYHIKANVSYKIQRRQKGKILPAKVAVLFIQIIKIVRFSNNFQIS